MVQSWFMDSSDEDQRLEHHLDPPRNVSMDELHKLSGVLYWKMNFEQPDKDPELEKIRKNRNYTYHDVIEIAPDILPNYEERIKIFFKEHLHSDEEIRLVLEGSGYFDVRDVSDRWIRIKVEQGDLLILPAGIYHRFTLDDKNYIKAMRLFVGEPVWTPINRPADDQEARHRYLKQVEHGFEE